MALGGLLGKVRKIATSQSAKELGKLTIEGAVELVKKSGALESLAAWEKRGRDSRQIDSPRAGTPLLVSLGEVAEHSGIFLGRSRVAELNGNGRLLDVSLSEFLNGQPDEKTNFRCGTQIFAACDAETGMPLTSPKVAHTARDFITNVKRVKYNLFCNNCHLFTASCVQGVLLKKLSGSDWIKNGTFSIACLEKVISDVMNAGRPIVWLGVRKPSRFFNYALVGDNLPAVDVIVTHAAIEVNKS